MLLYSVFASLCVYPKLTIMMLIIYHPSLWLIKPTLEHVDGEDIFELYI